MQSAVKKGLQEKFLIFAIKENNYGQKRSRKLLRVYQEEIIYISFM